MKNLFLLIICIFLHMHVFALSSETAIYRWRNDNGNEKTATWKADQYKPVLLGRNDINSIIRLRINFDNSLPDGRRPTVKTIRFKLMCDSVEITADTSSNNPFVLAPSAYITHGTTTTKQITGDGYYIPGKVITQPDNGSITLQAFECTEIEWCLKITRHIQANHTYKLRAMGSDSTFFPAHIVGGYDIGTPSPDSLISLSFAPYDRKIFIRWQTALDKKHNGFILQRSINGIEFDDYVSMPGGNGKKFEYVTALPDPGKHVVRMVLIDENNNKSYTRPAEFTAEPVIKVGNATAKREDNGTTTLTVNTQFERFINSNNLYYSLAENAGDSSAYKLLRGKNYRWYIFNNKPTSYTETIPGHPEKIHIAFEYDKNNKKAYAVKTFTFPPASQPLSIYPNPANSGNVSFDLQNYTGKTLTATLTNINGRQVVSQQFTASKTGKYRFNTTAQPGLYVLNIQGDDGTIKSGKVLVE